MRFQKDRQGRRFFGAVGEARTVQIVDGHVPAPGNGQVDAFQYLCEAVSPGPEIGMVEGLAYRIHAHADAVQSVIQQGGQHVGKAGVGVHVDGAVGGLFPDQADGRADNPGRHQRVAFAALAKADHTVFYPVDVRQGHAGDLFGRRGEGDAVLAAGQVRILLKGYAAQAAGIAGARGGQGRLIPAQKEVFARGAAVCQGAVLQVAGQAVVRQLHAHPVDTGNDAVAGHAAQVLAGFGVHHHGRRTEAVPVPAHRAVCEQGQHLGPGTFFVGTGSGQHHAGRVEGCHGKNSFFGRIRIPAKGLHLRSFQVHDHRYPVRQKHQFAAMGHVDGVPGGHDGLLGPVGPHGGKSVQIENLTLFIGHHGGEPFRFISGLSVSFFRIRFLFFHGRVFFSGNR